MHYKVTCLYNSDYCEINSGDKVCQYNLYVNAESKMDAVMIIHKENRGEGNKGNDYNVIPIVYEIKEILS